MATPDLTRWVSRRKAADIVGGTPQTITKWMNLGKIPPEATYLTPRGWLINPEVLFRIPTDSRWRRFRYDPRYNPQRMY